MGSCPLLIISIVLRNYFSHGVLFCFQIVNCADFGGNISRRRQHRHTIFYLRIFLNVADVAMLPHVVHLLYVISIPFLILFKFYGNIGNIYIFLFFIFILIL